MTILGVLALLLLSLAPVARGHAELAESDPAPGSDVDDPPVEVVLTFDGELDPASGFVVTDATGAEVGNGTLDLEVAERNALRGPVEISEPGVYTVAWTAVSTDGHPEEGSYRFGYLAEVTGNADDDHEGAAPDTAVRVEPASPLTPIGACLLALATAMRARRLVETRGRG
jgi:methionine-rich copper-binding protein CopC